MQWFDVLSIVLLLGIAWFWIDSIKAREIAVQRARQECEAEGAQFLDDTVASTKTGFTRDDDGRVVLRRVYSFEYSDTGNNRRPGSIVMQGQDVLFVNVGLRVMPTLH
jgi:hypothetical protein